MRRGSVSSGVVAVLWLGAGCGLDGSATAIFDAGPPRSTATMAPLNGTSSSGQAVFTLDLFGGGAVTLDVTMTGVVPDGQHGIHIHAMPDCSSPDGESAGPHWNPLGGPEAVPAVPLADQLGELGNLTIAGGTGSLTISKPAWTLGDGALTDVVGRAVIVHRDLDAGPRIACGVTPPGERL